MHSHVRPGIPLALGLALFTLAAEATAERPSGTSARLMQQAHAAIDEGRLADARDLWMAVWRLERSQVAACNLGALSFRLGDAPAAVRWLSLCKEIMRKPRTPGERELYESRLADLARARQLVGELRVVAPAGAAVTIDGEPVELEDGKPVPVLPGRHVVRASSDGRTAVAEVDVPRGGTREVRLTFAAPSGEAGAAGGPGVSGGAGAASEPGAAGGAGVAGGPGAAPDAADGRGAAGGAGVPRPSPSPPRPGPRPDVIVGGVGLSATLAALGGVMMMATEKKEAAGRAAARSAGPSGCFRMTWPMCRDSASAYGDMRAFQTVGIAAFAAGGAVLGATLTYALVPRGQAELKASAEGIAVMGVF
ncbi:hypothetical protein WMF04_43290 [Sorangium sp. So ce260]|uniref:hypothetical protein n=1 Tax=Sorangium sp. So ce260 TaxID=3133291 RepID=UPI003F61B4E2